MIIDTLEHISSYFGLLDNLDEALRWLQTAPLKELSPGKHLIHGEDIFCNVIEAPLRQSDMPTAEAHREYLDIHVALEEGEEIAFSDVSEISAWTAYDEKTDSQTATVSQPCSRAVMRPGMLAVCFPQDAHCPLLTGRTPKTVRKVIVKVRIAQTEKA